MITLINKSYMYKLHSRVSSRTFVIFTLYHYYFTVVWPLFTSVLFVA